jgi:hypothetical protein
MDWFTAAGSSGHNTTSLSPETRAVVDTCVALHVAAMLIWLAIATLLSSRSLFTDPVLLTMMNFCNDYIGRTQLLALSFIALGRSVYLVAAFAFISSHLEVDSDATFADKVSDLLTIWDGLITLGVPIIYYRLCQRLGRCFEVFIDASCLLAIVGDAVLKTTAFRLAILVVLFVAVCANEQSKKPQQFFHRTVDKTSMYPILDLLLLYAQFTQALEMFLWRRDGTDATSDLQHWSTTHLVMGLVVLMCIFFPSLVNRCMVLATDTTNS